MLVFLANGQFDRDEISRLAAIETPDPVTTGSLPPKRPKF
jgi:hypothetical protein